VNSEIPLFSILILLCAGQGLFLAFTLIFSNTNNWLANRYLGFFTLLIAIEVADTVDMGQSALVIQSVLYPRNYLYGPALYFYVREMTLPGNYPLTSRQWLHFLPTIIHVAIYWLLPFIDAPIHRAFITGEVNPAMPQSGLIETMSNIEILTSMVHVAIYLWLSIRILNHHEERIKAAFSYIERINLHWLRRLVIGVLIVYLMWVFEDFFSDILNLENTFDGMLSAGLVILIYTMSYLGLRQPVIFTRQSEPAKSTDASSAQQPAAAKYKTSSLSHDLSQALLGELQQLMRQDRPYLDSLLSLPKLAEQLDVSTNQLSQIINEQLQQNFFDFVNSYRVGEAKTQLQAQNYQNRNILTIATDVGFNSKSAFYTAFKKHTGMTPGEFRKQTDKNLSSTGDSVPASKPNPRQ
jgi:AraC-like DNA-binding protein